MSSLYWDYIFERDQLEVIELEDGFLIYKRFDEHWYVQDFYVRPEKRNTGVGQLLWAIFIQKAKDEGALSVGGTLRKDMPYLQENLEKFKAKAGMEVVFENDNDIEIFKEI